MSSEEKERSRGLYWVVGAVVLVPLLYALSIGPVGRACERAGLDSDGVEAFYAPLEWLHGNTPLAKPLRWYVRLWGLK
jgi:hypothetical protein